MFQSVGSLLGVLDVQFPSKTQNSNTSNNSEDDDVGLGNAVSVSVGRLPGRVTFSTEGGLILASLALSITFGTGLSVALWEEVVLAGGASLFWVALIAVFISAGVAGLGITAGVATSSTLRANSGFFIEPETSSTGSALLGFSINGTFVTTSTAFVAEAVLWVQDPLLLALSTSVNGAGFAFEGLASLALISSRAGSAFLTALGTFSLIILEIFVRAGCAFSSRAGHTVLILAGIAGLAIAAGQASITALKALVGFLIKVETSIAGSTDFSTGALGASSWAVTAALVFLQVEFILAACAFSWSAGIAVSSRAGIAGFGILASVTGSTASSANSFLWEEVSFTGIAGVLGAIFTVGILAGSALLSRSTSLAGSTASSTSSLFNEPTITAGCASVNVLTADSASWVLILTLGACVSVFVNTPAVLTVGTLGFSLVLAVLNSGEGVGSDQSEQKSE